MSSTRTKTNLRQKRTTAGKRRAKRKLPFRKLVDDVTGVLLISPNARKLSEFYKTILGIPLKEERHGGPTHYGYSLGDVHFAIHSADSGWPGIPTQNAQSPIIAFSTSSLKPITKRLAERSIKLTGPTDHGFGWVVSFRDPDGNSVMVVEYGPDYW